MDNSSTHIAREYRTGHRTIESARSASHNLLANPGSWPELSTLAASLDAFKPLPRKALFLGVAADGMPVLLDLDEASTGAILVVADPGAGKTAFLRYLACATEILHSPRDIQFGVLTSQPGEWGGCAEFSSCVEILQASQKEASFFLDSLVAWAIAQRNSRQAVLVLLDGLQEVVELPPRGRTLLYWLLHHGPANKIWPIVTLDAEHLTQVQGWLAAFRTHIFGAVSRGCDLLGYHQDGQAFEALQEEGGYLMRENGAWLRFGTPGMPG